VTEHIGRLVKSNLASRYRQALRHSQTPAECLRLARQRAGAAGRRRAASHAGNAGTNISGAGGSYPIEAWGLLRVRLPLTYPRRLDILPSDPGWEGTECISIN